ncbi:hypothetical protein BGW38_003777 [Lunasporangiospora selenospora]|uniref:Uncharacterized protein n=1 Tax=Lunasporangiospora selenospora TaxID=979761 RepID=A0A9P6FRD7_9FUNG|nr:hypothetical protein BGW38_003777 [Lunasporangiospora selenospora]
MAFTFPGRAHSRLGSIAESSLNAPGASDQWIRKKINRRSLSADSPFAGISPNPRGKTGSSSKYEKSRSQEAPTEVETREGSTFAQHQRQMREQEFLQNSIEFLKTHHNGDQKTECWKNRNKRKTLRPDMRQTSSCVADLGSSRAGSTVDPVIWEEENGSDAWEPVSIWSELGTEELHHDDLNGPVQDANKVSPTQFYDSTQSRKVLRDHLLSDEGAFEQMLAHGFPSTSKASSTAESGEGAGNFMTLRLTLTPWHARADENSLYGGNTDRTKHPHLRSMVNKLLSRSSGPLPASSPRSMSLTSSPLTHLDSINGRHTPSLPSPINSSIYSRDSLLTKMGPVRERSGSLSSTTGSMDARMHLCKDSIALTRSLAVKGRPVSPRKDQGFRIVDPSAMYSSAMTSKVIEHETLHRCISPPLTPSPIEKQSQHEANSLQQPMPSSNQKSPGASATSTYNRDNYITPRPKKCISSTLPTPPIVPPRRKSSTPSLYFPGERLMPASPKIVASPSLPCTLRESRQQCASPSASGARGIQNMFNISLTPPKESNLSGWMDRSSSPSHCHSSPILRGETCSSVTNSPRQYSYDHNKQQDLQQRLTWQGHHPFHDSHRPNEYSARPDQETSNDCAQEPVRAVAEGVGSSMCCSSSENLLACVPTPPVTPKTPTKWTAPEPNFYSSSTIQQDHLKCHHPHPRRPGMLSPMSEQQPNVGPHHV